MQPVSALVTPALAAVLRKTPFSEEKLAFAWRLAVGPGVERATTIRLDGGVLYVQTRDEAWRAEIARSRALVASRLDALLGAGVVKRIVV